MKIFAIITAVLFINTFLIILPLFYESGADGTYAHPIFEWMSNVGAISFGAYFMLSLLDDIFG